MTSSWNPDTMGLPSDDFNPKDFRQDIIEQDKERMRVEDQLGEAKENPLIPQDWRNEQQSQPEQSQQPQQPEQQQ